MTWKQFFVHMAVVVLGLLIAIGLEQSVEYLHHRHQRHQLEEDLRGEAIRNLHIASDNISIMVALDDWRSQQARELENAARENRPPRYIQAPPTYNGRFTRLSDAVWTVAQSSTTLNLVPRSEAESFAHAYFNVQQSLDELRRLNEANQVRSVLLDAASDQSFYGRFAQSSSTYDLSRLSKEDRVRFHQVNAECIAAARSFAAANLTVYILTWGPLHGYTDEENNRNRAAFFAAFAQGGTAAILQKFPIPDDEDTHSTKDAH